MECLRKVYTKILNDRIANTCIKHNVLQGLNYASLKGATTENPIMVINAILEDAKDNNRDVFLACQDMAKAFDSVSLISLDAAMNRIRIPQQARNFIINLFQNRHIRTIIRDG